MKQPKNFGRMIVIDGTRLSYVGDALLPRSTRGKCLFCDQPMSHDVEHRCKIRRSLRACTWVRYITAIRQLVLVDYIKCAVCGCREGSCRLRPFPLVEFSLHRPDVSVGFLRWCTLEYSRQRWSKPQQIVPSTVVGIKPPEFDDVVGLCDACRSRRSLPVALPRAVCSDCKRPVKGWVKVDQWHLPENFTPKAETYIPGLPHVGIVTKRKLKCPVDAKFGQWKWAGAPKGQCAACAKVIEDAQPPVWLPLEKPPLVVDDIDEPDNFYVCFVCQNIGDWKIYHECPSTFVFQPYASTACVGNVTLCPNCVDTCHVCGEHPAIVNHSSDPPTVVCDACHYNAPSSKPL